MLGTTKSFDFHIDPKKGIDLNETTARAFILEFTYPSS